MKKSYLLGLLLAAAAVAVAVGIATTHWPRVLAARSFSSSNAKTSTSSTKGATAPNNSTEPSDDETVKVIRFASNATDAPPFLVNDLQGHVISTAQFRGHVVLLSFWATWCPPCRLEIPELETLQSRYKDQLQIIGVSMDDDGPRQVAQFAERVGINYSVVMGSAEIAREYGGVPALPTNFLINPEGKVVQKHVGLYPLSLYDTEVRALLGMHVDAKVETFKDEGQIFLKNASLATELPGVDFKGLTEAQKKAALKLMNSEECPCGCQMTVAQCRLMDPSCPVSKATAAKIIQEVRSGVHASAAAAVARAAGE
ncbi:MAG TPA: TlpA disulfide reductase family protein [Candidatus Acidoferrum sp.]|nr:TlpA disulfide reductase family protein [Candidatus Acidoferrum sp.]